MTLSDGSSLDSSFISFATIINPTITVYTTDSSKIGTYSLLIKGTITGQTNFNNATFSLVISDPCSASVISSSTIPDYTYDISSGLMTISTLSWS
jgi:hypothetical protein